MVCRYGVWELLYSAEFSPPSKKPLIIVFIMTPVEQANLWLTIIISASTIVTTLALGVRWLTRHYFDEIKAELKPNSGSSLKDQVSRLEKEMKDAHDQRKETNQKIDHIYEVLLDYIASNSKPQRKK